MRTGQRGFSPIGIIIIILTLLALGVIVYYFQTVKNSASRQTTGTSFAVGHSPEQVLMNGVLGYRYHLTKEGGAVGFVLVANSVPWTDPLFNSENYARKVELGNMLKTVRLNT